jgi:tRNA threonylcarbamoyl adenosine modification protein YeaZ
MTYSLALQYPYETVQVSLCRDGKILQTITEHKFNAIRSTIPNIQALLQTHNLTLKNISFIAVNVGPGPYNTLRALLTMANGLHFAAQIPLISVSALKLLQDEFEAENSLVILHAFADHVFCRMKLGNDVQEFACNVKTLIEKINQQPHQLLVLGNGAIKYEKFLMEHTNKQLIFPDPIPAFNDIATLASAGFEKWQKKEAQQSYVKPIYFDEF